MKRRPSSPLEGEVSPQATEGVAAAARQPLDSKKQQERSNLAEAIPPGGFAATLPSAGRDGRITAGIVALAFIAVLICGAFAGLILEGAGNPSGALAAFDPYLLRVARFTLWQAALSTLLSALPALAMARMRSPGFLKMCSLRNVDTLSRPALVRVSAIITRPSRTRIPQQYVM